ncbi:DUF6922 domain-containing protein [Pedobacter borealis]|uniref:DUF6922 domain-containing protein n=1 Tax=Pedobacter borealis TaxID=475254 RepID=UPI001AE085B4|nr:hypothetical protein [Pedobacter borealis]
MQKGNNHSRQEVFLVNWKKEKGHWEIFGGLEIFCMSYPRFDLVELRNAFSFSRTVFDNDEVHIEKKVIVEKVKPDLPRMFFWEFNCDLIDWQDSRAMVIQRVIERGMREHWQELIRFYGLEVVISSLKEEITYLPDPSIDEVSSFFNLKKEHMLCYNRKLVQPKLWL